MNWYWLRPTDDPYVDDGRRTIVAAMAVPETLIDSVRAHLSGLDIKWIEEPLDEFFIDGGGMAFMDAPTMTLAIEGVPLLAEADALATIEDQRRKKLAEDVNKEGVRLLVNTTPRGSGQLGEA